MKKYLIESIVTGKQEWVSDNDVDTLKDLGLFQKFKIIDTLEEKKPIVPEEIIQKTTKKTTNDE